MIGNAIVEFEDLRKLSGLGERARRATIERWATSVGIAIKPDGNGGIWTTVDAMNAALGLPTAKADLAPYGPEDLSF